MLLGVYKCYSHQEELSWLTICLYSSMRLRQAAPLLHQARRRISALYVTGDKAKENYAVLTPYMEFSKTLIDEQDALRDNIAKRRLNLNLDEVLKKYEVYRSKETLKADLELRRDEIAKEIKELQKTKVSYILNLFYLQIKRM